jgi:hypothetical protein
LAPRGLRADFRLNAVPEEVELSLASKRSVEQRVHVHRVLLSES